MSTMTLAPARSFCSIERSVDEAEHARAAQILSHDLSFLVGIPYDTLSEEPLDLESYSSASRLEAADERAWFRQLNFARYRAACLCQLVSRESPETGLLDEIERLVERADQIRNQLLVVFRKLTVSVARHFASPKSPLDELVSEGQVTLLAAISKFDPERGFRFSTYATHALRRRLLRFLRTRQRDCERFGKLPPDQSVTDRHRWTFGYEQRVSSALQQVEPLLAQLPPRDRYILRSRYGWGREFDSRTLQEIAEELGISRERVRQLEARSLKRLRDLAVDIDW